MRTLPNSAFFTRLQADDVQMCEVIDLETDGPDFHWATTNEQIAYTLSGTLTKYDPFPGQTLSGVRESTDLAVAVIDFVMANTGQIFSDLITNNDMDMGTIKVGRIFPDTPDLGRMEVYQGKLGDFSYDRNQIQGQARNQYGSANTRWPYFNYQDVCIWRFGGTGCGFDPASEANGTGSGTGTGTEGDGPSTETDDGFLGTSSEADASWTAKLAFRVQSRQKVNRTADMRWVWLLSEYL